MNCTECGKPVLGNATKKLCSVCYEEHHREKALERYRESVDGKVVSRFFEGDQCNQCGTTTRYVSNGKCKYCHQMQNKLNYMKRKANGLTAKQEADRRANDRRRIKRQAKARLKQLWRPVNDQISTTRSTRYNP